MSREEPLPPPPPPALGRHEAGGGGGDAPVDTARLDLGDHRATLTLPAGSPSVIATPMVTKATYNKAPGGPVMVPSAPGAQQLRHAELKGRSGAWKSYFRALHPAVPLGSKFLENGPKPCGTG